jgi:hypothetical protein
MPANDPVAVSAQFILPDLSELYVISSVEVLAKDWAFNLKRTYGFQCQGGGLWTFEYVDGANVVFQLGNDLRISTPDPPISLIPSLTGVAGCQPGFSVAVTPGNPSKFLSLTGGYIQRSNAFSFTVDFVEADFAGVLLTYNGQQILQTPVKAGTEGKGTFPFPAVNGWAIFSSDRNLNLPSYIEYEWLLTTTESSLSPRDPSLRTMYPR